MTEIIEPSRKKIFLLTDGEVNQPEEVIKLAKESQTYIHTFGIGEDCSRYLIQEVAKAARGSYSFVEDSNDNLKVKVIEALRKAINASLQGCKFSNKIAGAPAVVTTEDGQIGEAFRYDSVQELLILSREQFDDLQVNFHSDHDPVTKGPIDIPITPDQFRILEPGTSLSKVAVKKRAKELCDQIDRTTDRNYQNKEFKDPEAIKSQIFNLSVKY